MYYRHAPEIWSDFPQLSAATLIIDGISPEADVSADLEPWYDKARARLAESSEGDMPEIAAWRRAYTQMGLKATKYRCAAESLLRRFKKEDTLPSIHPLVDLCNALSLAYAIPIALYDVDQMAGGLEVHRAKGGEEHAEFDGNVSQAEPDEVIFTDDDNHAHSRRWCFRQSKKSTVSSETKTVLLVMEAQHDTAAQDIASLLETLKAALSKYWSLGDDKILTADDPTFEWTLDQRATGTTFTKSEEKTSDIPKTPRVLSGMQPSGQLHVGNYFGSMMPNLAQAKNAEESIFFIVDLHALTTIQDAAKLEQFTKEALRAYLAVGFDPDETIIFLQSQVSAHAELQWILDTVTPMGLLERSVSYKDKIQRGLTANAGLFTYPVLMTADIILYDIHLVPVGKDQKQHVEIARDIALKFNNIYGETFVPPEPLIQEEVAIVPGIDGQKMSKSYGNTIPLFGDEKQIEQLIMSIQTDSKGVDEPKDPETSPIFLLHKLFLDETEAQALADEYRNGIGYGDAKKKLFATYMDYFAPTWKKHDSLTDEHILEVAAQGAQKAGVLAEKKMTQVRKAVGLL